MCRTVIGASALVRFARGVSGVNRTVDVGKVMTMPVHNWTMKEYLAFEAMSSGGVHCLAKKSPLHYDKVAFRQSKAMAFGSLQHMAVLEPHMLSQKKS